MFIVCSFLCNCLRFCFFAHNPIKIIIFKWIYLTHRLAPNRYYYYHSVKVDMRVMAIKRYSTLECIRCNLDISRTLCFWGGGILYFCRGSYILSLTDRDSFLRLYNRKYTYKQCKQYIQASLWQFFFCSVH